MALNLFLLIYVFFLSPAQTDVINSTDAETCADLCKSCNGIATFEDDRCECFIEETVDEGAECVLRMRREATEHGLDVVSCDLSSDKRSTRCLLGSKYQLDRNDIDQVAKYFMEDGPITGTIFQAPPYTNTRPPDSSKYQVLSSNSDCADEPSRIVLNTLQETTPPAAQIVGSPQSQHIVSSPHSPHIVSRPQSSHIVSSPQSPRIVSSPQSSHIVSTPQSSHAVSSPRVASSPQSLHFALNNDQVGAPKVITQPKETMVAPTLSLNNCAPTLGKAATKSNSPIVGDINSNQIRDENSTSNFLQILSQQLSRPMFGIPDALQTVSQTPGISNLVSAPANLIYTFLQRLSENSNQVASSRKASEPTNIKVGIPKVTVSNPNNISPVVGAQIPTFNYNYPPVGSQLISVLNPTVGIPAATAQMSYISQMPAAMPAAMPMFPGPIVGSISPYNSFMPQVPTTYMVGAPLGYPYYTNFNTAAASPSSFNTVTSYEEIPSTIVEHKVDPASNENVGLSFLESLKRICKKSPMEEKSVKKTRDIKNFSESVLDEIRFQQIKRQLEQETTNRQKKQHLYTPKIDRTTTQKSVTEKSSEKNDVEKKLKENEKIEKNKAEKPIVEKYKPEKDIKMKNKPLKEIVKKSIGEKKGT